MLYMHQIILHVSENFLRKNIKIIMTIDDQIRDEKWYDINREAAKISASSFGKIGKYEYFTGK